MRKNLVDAKGLWVEELPEILWVLRTTPNFTTKETSFTLAFRHKAIILAKIGVNTLKISRYNTDDNNERLRINLDMINEIREEA